MHLIELSNVFFGGLLKLINELFDLGLVLINLLLHNGLSRGGFLDVTLEFLDQLPLLLKVAL